MNIQVELSLYPLRTARVGNIIARFAKALRGRGLQPETGAMSTLVKGESRKVFAAVARAFKACGSGADMVLVLKASNACPAMRPKQKQRK